MGRLFWKFFVFIWLAQLAAILGTGALFWLERQEMAARFGLSVPGDRPPLPLPGEMRPPPGPAGDFPPPPGLPHRPPPFPFKHVLAGLFASLLSAAALAWYIAQPIRRLRQAFEAVSDGDLQVAIGAGMGRRRDELADLGRDFDRMTARLRSLLDGQQRLLHDVSHELRSPLARLHAAIGLARQQPARLEDTLQRIEREGERMNRLVGELLTLSRLEAGVAGELETLDLGDLLSDLVADARFEAAARHVTVDASPVPDLLVRAHAELLHRAIENVLRNALRHSPEGGVVRLEVSQPLAGRCRIAIADQGPGVPEALLENIFTPFFRGEGQAEGYGLGLAIARRSLLAAGGAIQAMNQAQGGLLLEIDLPVFD